MKNKSLLRFFPQIPHKPHSHSYYHPLLQWSNSGGMVFWRPGTLCDRLTLLTLCCSLAGVLGLSGVTMQNISAVSSSAGHNEVCFLLPLQASTCWYSSKRRQHWGLFWLLDNATVLPLKRRGQWTVPKSSSFLNVHGPTVFHCVQIN